MRFSLLYSVFSIPVGASHQTALPKIRKWKKKQSHRHIFNVAMPFGNTRIKLLA